MGTCNNDEYFEKFSACDLDVDGYCQLNDKMSYIFYILFHMTSFSR